MQAQWTTPAATKSALTNRLKYSCLEFAQAGSSVQCNSVAEVKVRCFLFFPMGGGMPKNQRRRYHPATAMHCLALLTFGGDLVDSAPCGRRYRTWRPATTRWPTT